LNLSELQIRKYSYNEKLETTDENEGSSEDLVFLGRSRNFSIAMQKFFFGDTSFAGWRRKYGLWEICLQAVSLTNVKAKKRNVKSSK